MPAYALSGPVGDGAVAQLGERLVRNEEVRGSIPLSSTTVPRIQAPSRMRFGEMARFARLTGAA